MKILKLKNYFLVGVPAPVNLIAIHIWLGKLMLHGSASRARTRFIRLLVERVKETEEERVAILERNADTKKVMEEVKGKDGKIEKKEVEKPILLYNWCPECKKILDPMEMIPTKERKLACIKCGHIIEEKETTDKREGKRYKMSQEGQKNFSKQYDEYLKETLTIDITPANRETIYGVRDLILDTKEEFSETMAVRYDEWCESFENIEEAKEEKKE